MRKKSPARALAEEPTVTVDEAAVLLKMSRAGAYNAIRDGNIPNIKIGRLIRVPSAPLRKLLGNEDPRT
jgi:excisionase family DNA binding protein